THTAGAAASARLLAFLPVTGLLLGEAVGVEPTALLLHTPLGAACAFGAAALQAAGLMWSHRIAAAGRTPGTAT
ncbi:MAG: type II secretion system F family protein, partial [Stackebrandtia sp.]